MPVQRTSEVQRDGATVRMAHFRIVPATSAYLTRVFLDDVEYAILGYGIEQHIGGDAHGRPVVTVRFVPGELVVEPLPAED